MIEVIECFYGIYREHCLSFWRIIKRRHWTYLLSNSTLLVYAELIFATKKLQIVINALDDKLSKNIKQDYSNAN